MFGLTIKHHFSPIALQSFLSDKRHTELVDLLSDLGRVHLANSVDELIAYRFLFGSMVYLLCAQTHTQPSSHSRAKRQQILACFQTILPDEYRGTSDQLIDMIEDGVTEYLRKEQVDTAVLRDQVVSPGGVTERIKPMLDYDHLQVGDITRCLEDISLDRLQLYIAHHIRILSAQSHGTHWGQRPDVKLVEIFDSIVRLWPRWFSYLTLVNYLEKRPYAKPDSLGDTYKGALELWEKGRLTELMATPQELMDKRETHTQSFILWNVGPTKEAYQNLGLLHNCDTSDIPVCDLSAFDSANSSGRATAIMNFVSKARANADWLERCAVALGLDDLTRDESDRFYRFCVWWRTSIQDLPTRINVFLPFSHAHAIPFGLHVGCNLWPGIHTIASLRSLLIARILPFLESRASNNAHRAAAAAILARNMSHNIGSHVTPRTKLDDLKRRVREMLIQDDWWDGGDWNYKAFPIIEKLKDRLDDYIQRKAEFIAEFSTDPLISTRGAWFFKEVIQPLIDNTALMDTLAANEGFTYKDYLTPRLVIQCWYAMKNGERQNIKATYCSDWVSDEELDWTNEMLGAPYAMRHIDFATKELYSKTPKNDVRVSLPGPVGDMAVYSILENVIRNAAKHGSKDRGPADDRKPLVVNVMIDEGCVTGPNCTITVWDNLSDPRNKIKDIDLQDIDLRDKMHKLVGMDIIDADGQLRKEAWGTAEMALCANLLQRHPPGVAHSIPCLEVLDLDHSEDDNGKCLTYKFEIPKARTAVFFGWDSDEIAKGQEATLASAGFLLRSVEELTAHTETILPACDFAVINAEKISASGLTAIYNTQRHRIPFRIIFVGAPEFYDAAVGDCLKKRVARTDCPPEWKDSSRVTSWLWETWISHLRRGEQVGSDIYLQQKSTERPTKEWIDQANTYNGEIDEKGFSKLEAPLRVWAQDENNRIECFTKTKGVHSNERRVVVDRHGNLVHETGVGSQENDCSIIIDKSSTDFDALFNPSFAQPWTVPYELAEAGLLSVLVVDERIVQGALRDFEEMGAGKDAFRRAFTGNTQLPATAWHVARKAGVHVATRLVLNPAAQDQTRIFTIASRDWAQTVPSSEAPWTEISIEYSLTNNMLQVSKVTFVNQYKDRIDPDLVIVHQGVADCLNDKVDGLGKEFLEVLSQNHWLIVESGRGIPPEVEKTRHKFLTFSAIDRAFRNGRMAKLALTRVTMSATRHKVGGAHE
jgi:hypothetical protein